MDDDDEPLNDAEPASSAAPCTFAGYELDEGGCYPISSLILGTKGCDVRAGACFTWGRQEEPPPDLVPLRKTKRKAPVSDPIIPAHINQPLPSESAVPILADSPHPSPAPAPAPLVLPPIPSPPSTTAITEPAPHTAVNELMGLLPKDGSGGSAVTVALALIAVAGGGAGWKFYQSFAKQKHEQRMKELELKEKRMEFQEERREGPQEHKPCEAARAADRAALETKLAELEDRLAEATKTQPVSLPFDPDELQERIEQLEQAFKKPAGKGKSRKAKAKAKPRKKKV